MLEELNEKVYKMPQPEFVEVSRNSKIAFTSNEKMPIALTINWQWVLEKIGKALIARDARSVIKLLFSDVDYLQINHNAVEEIRSIIRQSVDENTFRETIAKINSVKELISEYLYNPQDNQARLDYIINESSFVVQKLKSLEIVGLGAFMIASGLRLALLQEKAKSDQTNWNSVKDQAIEYSNYAASVTPKLFELSVGQIDKECKCKRWESRFEGEKRITEYECCYFDGKDLHIFRQLSSNAEFECNKHRLQMFQSVTDNVVHTVVQPMREAINRWRELATSL